MGIVLHSPAPARSDHPAFPITSRDWSDTWKHICYYLFQPFGNDITQILGGGEAGKYCHFFIIPAIPSLVIAEKFPGQWDYFIFLPLPLSPPSPHRYPCPNGTLQRGVCLTRVTWRSSFSPLANAKLPPSPPQPGSPGHPLLMHPSPGRRCRWRRQMLLSAATKAKSSPYGNWNMFCVFKLTKQKEKLLKNQLSRDFIPVLNLKDGRLN